MFTNQKFITKGIEIEIPPYLQNMMWYMVESMEVPEKDYLQVFHLETVLVDGVVKQKIIHSQEQPEYKNEQIFKLVDPISAKIFVIDDESHTTMLLANEY